MTKKIRPIQTTMFDLVQIAALLFIPLIISVSLYKIIPIQNVNALSIVSVTASLNVILWLLIILQIIANYPLIKSYSFRIVVQINLFILLVYIVSIKILIKALALKGTPLPSSDIRGDLLVIFNLATIAESGYWSGQNYPPLWPSVIGNLARILDVYLLSLFKPAEFVILILAPILILFVWRLILNPIVALVITLNQTLFTNFDYKNLTLNLIIPLFIYSIIKIKEPTISGKFRFFTLGFVLGFISLSYFGYIYWLLPMLIAGVLLAFFAKEGEKYLQRNAHLFLGLAAGLGPVIYYRFIENILVYYVIIIGIFLISLFSKNFMVLGKFIHILVNIGIFLALLVALLTFRAGDTWGEGGIEKNDPTVKYIISLSQTNLAIFFLVIFAFLILILLKKDVTIILILIAVYLSSATFMYFIASQMQVTSRVDLWPRALEVQGYALSLIFLFLFLFLIEGLITENNLIKYLNLSHINLFYLMIFILFFFGSYLVSSLGSSAHASMPYHSFTGAWFAHQGCSNPHEDPMLSKVFESYPDIQNFLRENCSAVNWPPIPN